jgi:hypothetical protein
VSTPRKYSYYQPKVPVPYPRPAPAYVVVDPATWQVHGTTYYLQHDSAVQAAAPLGLAVRTVGWYTKRFQVDPREGRNVHAPDVPVMGSPTHKARKEGVTA